MGSVEATIPKHSQPTKATKRATLPAIRPCVGCPIPVDTPSVASTPLRVACINAQAARTEDLPKSIPSSPSSFIKQNEIGMGKRTALIVAIPATGFNEALTELKPVWKEFLKAYKPIGIVFYKQHFRNKEQARKMVEHVKSVLGDECLLAIDQEGGRVQRLHSSNTTEWRRFPSAESLADQFNSMRDPDEAKEYVRSEYREMFGQMKDLGLNTTFAPNCDVNFYKDDPGYKQYISYKAYWTKDKNEINPEEKDDYEAALLFKAYLQKTATYEKLKKHPDLESSDQLKIATAEKDKVDKEVSSKALKDKFQTAALYGSYMGVIGDRSYGKAPELVAKMSQLFIDAANKEGIICVPKHAPGHGRPFQDTHSDVASTDATREDLAGADLVPYKHIFKASNPPLFVMPSHVMYTKIDPVNIATQSKKVLDFIEREIDRKVIFVSDDLGMCGAKQITEQSDIDHLYPKRQCDILLSGNGTSLEKVKELAHRAIVSEDLERRLGAVWSFLKNSRGHM